MPTAGDTFEILTATAGITGTFVNEILPALGGNLFWDVTYGANSLTLAVAAPGLSGDFNNDGIVDAADYVVWRKTIGTPEAYDQWRANFGTTASSGSATTCGIAVLVFSLEGHCRNPRANEKHQRGRQRLPGGGRKMTGTKLILFDLPGRP